MKIQIINGPNLNLLGVREKEIYGRVAFDDFLAKLEAKFPHTKVAYFQSNIEGELVDKLQEVGFSCDGIVFNGGAYTHTSVAIHDAIGAIEVGVVEVHLSNLYARETFRHKNLISANCIGSIVGFGLEGYTMAVQYLVDCAIKRQSSSK